MIMTASQVCEELLSGLKTKNLECIHLTPEMTEVLCLGYKTLQKENARLRGKILKHLPTFAAEERKEWEEERHGN